MTDIRTIATNHLHRVGGPISALRAIVEATGYVDAEAQAIVAEVFNLSKAEVKGLLGFYSDLRASPPARRTVRLCQAEACQAVGARELARCLERKLGIVMGETTPDNRICLEPVYCLGLCANGPAAMVADRLYAELTEDDIEDLANE